MAAARPLVVIEAPGKCRRLTELFAQIDFVADVWATNGHIKVYPETLFPLGIAANLRERLRRFDPTRLDMLRKHAQGRLVYIATDADEEGDVIARDVAEAIEKDATRILRLRLHALDARSLRSALAQVSAPASAAAVAGDTRRILDRLIGHAHAKPGAPAGRVQTALIGYLSQNEPIVGHVRLSLPAADGGRPFTATVPITPSTRTFWRERFAQAIKSGTPGLQVLDRIERRAQEPLTFASAVALLEGIPLEYTKRAA